MQDHLSSPSLTNADALARRMVQCAHNRDGLPEMLVGFTFLVASAMSGTTLAIHGRAAAVLVMVFALLITVLGFTANRIVDWTRRRFLLQWVGYVQVRSPRKKLAVIAFLAAAFIGTVAVMGLRHFEPSAQLLVLVCGAFVSILQVVIGRLIRFWIAGGLILCAAFAIAMANWPMELALVAFFVCAGVINLVAGGITFFRLLQKRADLEA
jgi:hypothetical protein